MGKSLRNRLVGSMTLLLLGGLALIAVLHGVEGAHDFGGRLGRVLLGDELPEPWQDLAVLLPGGVVMLALIGLVTGWSLRPVLRASEEAAAVGPRHPHARIGTANLPSELSPLVEAVNQALDRLTLAYEAERRFTADAAHELRTPLAVLSLRLQRARSQPDGIEWLAIDADLAAMRRLIEGLLDLARKEAGRPLSTNLNLPRIVREAAAHVEPLVRQAGRGLLVELPDQLEVPGNADDLRDVVRNLVENALAHGQGLIRIRLERQSGQAVLDVSDEGPGIAKDVQETLFERFRKGAQSTSGSGLGLSIARAVIQAHGGHIKFEEASTCTIRMVLPQSIEAGRHV